MTGRRGFTRVFAMPVLLAALIAAGLASGVLGDGIWDVISWIALGVPLAVIAACSVKRRPASRRT